MLLQQLLLLAFVHLPPEVFFIQTAVLVAVKKKYFVRTKILFVHPWQYSRFRAASVYTYIVPLMVFTGMRGTAVGRHPAAVKPPLYLLIRFLHFTNVHSLQI